MQKTTKNETFYHEFKRENFGNDEKNEKKKKKNLNFENWFFGFTNL